MKGDSKVIDILNSVLTGELTAINQYFLHARMQKNWGYDKIGDKVMAESIDEMKHAQTVTDRILFLEGLPNLQKISKLRIGENIPEQLQADLDLEMEALARLRDGIKVCYDIGDHTSRQILEDILADEESHVDWIENQLENIKDIGVENYLAHQLP